jgi:hypothetical protein
MSKHHPFQSLLFIELPEKPTVREWSYIDLVTHAMMAYTHAHIASEFQSALILKTLIRKGLLSMEDVRAEDEEAIAASVQDQHAELLQAIERFQIWLNAKKSSLPR